MKKYSILMIAILLFSVVGQVFPQEGEVERITVTGKVIDENDEPLIGANVVLKENPGFGTVTDIDGNYKIKIEPFTRLVFSYMGYENSEVLVKGQLVVNVKMEVSIHSALDELVVTGTGRQKKMTVTGAVTTVNVEQLKSNPTSSIVNALAGNVAGVMAMQTTGQPGNNISEFWIRGISTFGAGGSALVLVDGFERDMSQINTEDIESFSVLKDASETAIYGSRGANGIVLITTKRGKEGKINIDAKVETIYNTRTFTPDFVDGYTYASMMNEARITRNREPIFLDSELDILRMGLDPDLLPDVDWKDLLLKKGSMTYRASMNMNGGGQNVRYYISTSYINEGGMYKTDESLKNHYKTNPNHERYNYRMNADVNITQSTLLKVGIGGMFRKRNEPGAWSHDIWKSIMGYNPVSSPVMYSNGYTPSYDFIEESDGISPQMNPWVLSTQTGFTEQWWNEVQTSATIEQNLDFLTKGLNFVGRFGFDTYSSNTIRRLKRPELWRAERFRDQDGEIVFKRVADKIEMNQYSWSEGDRKEYLEAELYWDRQFSGHNLAGTLKYTQDSKVQTQNVGGDVKNSIARRHQGLAGRVAYNWSNRYFLNFNFGYTGSENFAPGNQWGFFPAFSTAWNIAEEPLLKKHLEWMEMFKIRYSYGRVGNDQMDVRFPYLYTIGDGESYDYGDYNFGNWWRGLRYTQPGSDNITWEVAKKHDLGVDLSFWSDKFSLTADFFHEQRDGIFMVRNFLPHTSAFDSAPFGNVGSVKTDGLDGNFAVNHHVGTVNFTVRGNMTLSKNEILERDEENNVYKYQMERGYRVDQARGLIALGLFEDYDDIRNSPRQDFGTVQPGDIKYKDVNGDGVVNDGDRVAIGATTRPNLIYGAGLSANWNGFDVNVHFQGAGKSSFFINGPTVKPFSEEKWGNILSDVVGNYWISREISGTEATENPNAKYPRLSYGWNNNNYQYSSFWLRDGRYLRLKTVELGYTLPKVLTAKMHLNSLRVFVIGTNLFTWSSFRLWDPEQASDNGAVYPIAKSIDLGFSVSL